MYYEFKRFFKESVIAFISVLIFVFQSCRENAVDPNDSNGNVNEPVVASYYNSFGFQLNAEKITQYIVEQVRFTGIENQVSINVNDYVSGTVSVAVINKANNRNLFSADFNKSHLSNNQLVTGDIPYKVIIALNNFSGFFKLNLYSVNPY